MASLRQWVVLIALAATWGSSFILIKRALYALDGTELFTPVQVGALRISLAALFLSPFAFRNLQLLAQRKFKYFLIVGLCGNALPAYLFAQAQTGIPSAMAGMLNALTPVFALLIAVFVFRNKVRPMQIAGIAIGVVSALGLLLGSVMESGTSFRAGHALLAVLAALLYGVSLNTIKEFLQKEPSVAITSLALLLVSPVGFITLFSTDFTSRMVYLPGAWYAFGAVAILALAGTAIALVLFNRLIQETNALFASSVTYLIPVVAVLWGAADGEQLTAIQMLSAISMILGILLIHRK